MNFFLYTYYERFIIMSLYWKCSVIFLFELYHLYIFSTFNLKQFSYSILCYLIFQVIWNIALIFPDF